MGIRIILTEARRHGEKESPLRLSGISAGKSLWGRRGQTKSSEVVRQWFYGKLFTFFGRCFLHKFWDRTGALFQSLHVTI